MAKQNRTKIVATLGPASRSEDLINRLIRAGVDVFRLNSAHSDHETLVADIRRIRKTAKALDAGIGVLVDLQGPKIRVGSFKTVEPIWLRRGEELVISCIPGVLGEVGAGKRKTLIGCRYEGLYKDLKAGERILLDDGYMELRVLGIKGREIRAKVIYGGLLKEHKGINLPGSRVSMDSLTPKDLKDLECALSAEADFVALSFVRKAQDVKRLKQHVSRLNSDCKVIAKIERPEAIDNLDAIIAESDGVMIARGDMGVELGPEVVPAIQKKIIRKAVEQRKPVITATQMLESMITNPRPTRAEASDVANAIYDGSSAVMLSAETASGKHPLRSVRIMDRIIRQSEQDMFGDWEYTRRRRARGKGSSVTQATVRAAAYAALEADARLIAAFTESGQTALLISAERTPTRIIAFTPSQQTVQRLSLAWGVTAYKVGRVRTSHEMTLEGERILLERRLAKTGDRIIVLVGSSRRPGLTNIMNIRTLETGN